MKRITLALIIVTSFLIAFNSNAQEKSYGKHIHIIRADDVCGNSHLVDMARNMLTDIWAGKIQVYKAENIWEFGYERYFIDTTKPIMAIPIEDIIKQRTRTDSIFVPDTEGHSILYTVDQVDTFIDGVEFDEEAVYDEKRNTLKLKVTQARFYIDVYRNTLTGFRAVPFLLFLVKFKED